MRSHNSKPHPQIKGAQIIDGKVNFPISWLNQQGYCEYSLFLEYVQGVTTAVTPEMQKGQNIHQELEEKFKEEAVPTTFSDMMELSKKEEIMSRELWVLSPKYGIRGFIDEIWLTPSEFVIIDDKPGTTAYYSTINQVMGYCLAFKDTINDENRTIRAALRERGTDNIFWTSEFNEDAQNKIEMLISRMQDLFNGNKHFLPTKNPNKCAKCRFRNYCEFK
ncbi:CRISPR-associated protein Cas4 [Methanobacterium alcaliphilum]|uniref:CRISPR-associated protein Cas4 n=1 Tax=Methanobacterium alcaliphilum TaxID=392018 RepID=UPI00200A566E|nr:PD-(D/E)XK nuclease family protein [Methanobacterium alcaliphilum]MCK9151605.1 PD-(D/E)XK nuclease family protein [Methanobacterium alcaliphilum]